MHGRLRLPAKDTPIPPKIDPELQVRLSEATDNLAIAERELEAALGEIQQTQRADKKIISSRLAIAFEKLSSARRNLEAILREGS